MGRSKRSVGRFALTRQQKAIWEPAARSGLDPEPGYLEEPLSSQTICERIEGPAVGR